MVEKCDEHSKMCGDMGGVSANITNLTAAVVSLTAQINALSNPIYAEINGLRNHLNKHEVDAMPFREKVLTTEKALQEYMRHQKEKEEANAQDRKDSEIKIIQRMSLIVTIISIIAQILMKGLFKC